ncbi:MAG: DUF6065 family protein [Gemmataceae bacterium]|nr:DUF6065 family protein [Gemmataceae bacterium]
MSDDNRFYAYEIYSSMDMPVTPGPVDRLWMDESHLRAAYRCLPLTIANQAGWLIPSPVSFSAVWDGSQIQEGVRLTFDAPGRAPAVDPFGVNVVSFDVFTAPVHTDNRVSSHFGNGIITFSFPYLFRTPRGINLWVKGPSNYFKDGAAPLEGIVETDWLPATFTMNWRLTRPGLPVRFERGEPICMLVPVPRGLVESLDPVYVPLASEPELERAYREWEKSRSAFNADLRAQGSGAQQRGWQRDYTKGVTVTGQRADQHQTRLQLKEFRRIDSADRP